MEQLLTNTNISYVGDEKATRAAFDDEGFYRTGDQAHRVGDDFYFDGRLSQDCKSNIWCCLSQVCANTTSMSRDPVS